MGVHLYEVEPRGNIIRANAYGFPVIANSTGLVFAWAKGAEAIYIKLGEERHEAARKDHGIPNAEYGKDWVRFPVWMTPGQPVPPSAEFKMTIRKRREEWDVRLRYWMQVAYDDIMK